MRFNSFLIIIVFCILGWFLFTFRLLSVPQGINGDEAAIGYSAALITKQGHDSSGKLLPLFTRIEGSSDWKQPITLYSTVFIFKLLGISYFNLRMVSVLIVLLSGIITFFLAKEIFDEKLAVLSLLIYSTIPIIMIQSHLALENIAPVPFIAFWLWMFAKYSKKRRIKYLVLAAIALGISLYSYLGLRLMMPVLSLLSVCYIYYLNKKGNKKNYLKPISIFIIALLPFLAYLLIIKNQYPGAVFANNRPQHIISYQQFLLPYISSFDLSFLFMKGDLTPYHSTGRQGMFLLATLPLFLSGLFKIAKDRKPFFLFVCLVFFLSPILYGLPGSIYRSSRLLVLLPPFLIIATVGFKSLFELKRKTIGLSITFVCLVLIFLNFTDFVADYWFDYPNRVNQEFERPIHKVFDEADKLSKKENLEVFIQEGISFRNPSAYLFFENSYFPKGIKRWKEGDFLPKGSIVLISSFVYNRMNKSEGVEVIDYNSLDLTLLISR